MPPGNRLTENKNFWRDAPGETSLHGILKMWVRISSRMETIAVPRWRG
ncbi:MAG: hypothetical protein JETT_3091 [Candidatus Jettenia ecosi]|uniref:Uncharacterized protein n=1 Tax=Candidatus Jettenia ecosi TaxID=2494326 RepID=A0A533QJC1_9BACT|nr:MAG: hypothetical protein JETT_3091 [Candidatus Jettenia ecosi]